MAGHVGPRWYIQVMFVPGHILFAATQRLHFIGIGGIGMSGIAEVLLSMGYSVSGSDLRRTAVTDRLSALGAVIFEGHGTGNAAASDVVITSSAVPPDNPEILEAKRRKIPVIQRAEMLAELMRLKYGIAVAGMHGKTTTTSMIAAVLHTLDPTVIVGGRVDALGSNARLGQSQYLVAEADESDRSFLKLSPVLAVVTNLDREHTDCYPTMEHVDEAFLAFMDALPFYGATTACLDDPRLRDLLGKVRRRVFTYGLAADADFRLEPLPHRAGCNSTFGVEYRGVLMGPYSLHVPGRHNVLNATAAIAIGVQLGVEPAEITAGIAAFRGVDRRFQVKGVVRGVTVVDDYGHHPTEIVATLQAARDAGYTRVHVIFQPHRYTRTRDLLEQFAVAFGQADTVEILDIYAANEPALPGISGPSLAARIQGTAKVRYAPSADEAVARVVAEATEGDVVLTLGAGNISQAAGQVLNSLQLAFAAR